MEFSDLNLTRNWFRSFSYDMSNEAKDFIRELNSYPNHLEENMQCAIGTLHDCYYALDSLIDLVEDNTKNIENFVQEISWHKQHLIEDEKKLSLISGHPSQISINEVKKTVSNVLEKVQLLGEYAELEDKDLLIKDKYGNLKEIGSLGKIMDSIELHKFLIALTLVMIFACAGLLCKIYGFNEISNIIDYILKVASSLL